MKPRNKQWKSKSTIVKGPEPVIEAPKLFEYADLGRRGAAYAIDVIIVALPLGIFVSTQYGDAPDYRIILTISSLILFFYFFLFMYFNNGQTIGQGICRIRVIPAEVMDIKEGVPKKTKLTAKQAALHALGKIHTVILFDLIIGIALRKGRQEPTRLFQLFADTVVVEKLDIEKLNKLKKERKLG